MSRFHVVAIRALLMRLRFILEAGNVFNRTTFCAPNTNFSSPAFGTVNTQCNQPRSVQFGLRFDY